MAGSLENDGYEIRRGIFSELEIAELRAEVDIVAENAGTACVRHLREKSERISRLSASDRLMQFLPEGYRPVRSILFDKTKGENWPVLWHQDLTIAVEDKCEVTGYGPWSHKDGSHHVQPPTELLEKIVTIRIHLDDTSSENGALHVIPQSHSFGKICSQTIKDFDKSKSAMCECNAGDILLMSPLILHSSKRSIKPSRRRIIHLEYAREKDLDPSLQWYEKYNG